MMAFALFFAFSAADYADAKPRGGLKSPRQGVTTPSKPAENVSRSDSGTKATNPATGTTANRGGLFGGGSFMKGLMIGGLAGMLFGGLFGSMGFLGEILGLMINLLALFLLFAVIRAIFVYFRDRRKMADNNRRPY